MTAMQLTGNERVDLTYYAAAQAILSYQRDIQHTKLDFDNVRQMLMKRKAPMPKDEQLANVEGVQQWVTQMMKNNGINLDELRSATNTDEKLTDVNGKPFKGSQYEYLMSKVAAFYNDAKELSKRNVMPYTLADPRQRIHQLVTNVGTPGITVNIQNGLPLPGSTVVLVNDATLVGRENKHVPTVAPFIKGRTAIANDGDGALMNRLDERREQQFTQAQQRLAQNYRPSTMQQLMNYHPNRNKTGIRQVSDYLQPLLSNEDWNALQAGIINQDLVKKSFNPKRLQQAEDLLKHLQDEGLEYHIVNDNRYPQEFLIEITNANGFMGNPRVVLIDEQSENVDKGGKKLLCSRVGEVFTNEAGYFVSYNRTGKRSKERDWKHPFMNEPWMIIDTVLGRWKAETVYQDAQMRHVSLYPVGKPRKIRIIRDNLTLSHAQDKRIALIQPDDLSPQKADMWVSAFLKAAREMYYSKLIGPSMKEINAPLAEEQDKLQEKLDQLMPLYAGDNGFSPEEQAKVIMLARDYALGQEPVAPQQAGVSEKMELAAEELAGEMQQMADHFVGVADGYYDQQHLHDYAPVHAEQQLNYNHVEELANERLGFRVTNRLLASLQQSTWDPETQLGGNEFAQQNTREKMMRFNDATAQDMNSVDSQAKRDTLAYVQQELLDHYGLTNPEVEIDDHGIIKWSANREVGSLKKIQQRISGEIGQIFFPDEKGVIHTNFADPSANFDFVPASTGYFQYSGLEEGKSRMERFRLIDYGQLVKHQLDAVLAAQVGRRTLVAKEDWHVNSPLDATSLNKLYHGELYGRRIPHNWYEQSPLSAETKDAILSTLERRVRLSNDLGHVANSFIEADNDDHPHDQLADLVDGKNLRVLDNDYKGYFDPVMTGTNKTQGLVLYLGEGVEVNQDGSLKRVVDEQGKPKEVTAATRNLAYFEHSGLNPWDRNQMAANQLLTANGVAEDTHLMLGTFGGWTFEDSCVVSKEWAEKHPVFTEEGKQRPLMPGDKISDFSGNKATIGLVVDPEMSPEEAKRQNLTKEVAIFKQNPELEVVMSPYAMVSRQNAGIVQELINSDDKHTITYTDENGNVQEIGKSGTANMIITDMTADHKTKIYDRQSFAEGNGRKASSQLLWGLNELGLNKTTAYMFGDNSSSWDDIREKLLAVGMDLTADGRLVNGYHPREGEERPVITPEWLAQDEQLGVKANQQAQARVNDFVHEIANHGALLKLPFKVPTPTIGANGEAIETDVIPVMKPQSRHNIELFNGGVRTNEYTAAYANIYTAAYKYSRMQHELEVAQTNGELTEKAQQRFNNQLNWWKSKTLTSVKQLQDTVVVNEFGGYDGSAVKHCGLKEHLLNKRQKESATAIQTADPRLPLDKIKVSPEIAEKLHLQKDELVVIERDPILRGSGIWAMRWEVDPKLTGIAVNPTIAGAYDGDFDGDTLGVFAVHNKEAQAELRQKATLTSRMKDPTGNIVVADDMDLISSGIASGLLANNDDKHTPGEQLMAKINAAIEHLDKVNNTEEKVGRFNVDRLSHLITNELLHNDANFGAAHIDIQNRDTAEQSVLAITQSGAKGNPSKAVEFNKYLEGRTGEFERHQVQKAAGMKSDLTGVAGAMSQRLMKSLRNIATAVALEVTYPNTQGVLQIKHEPVKGEVVMEALTHDLPNLMAGIDHDSKKAARDNDETPHLSTDKWIEQMEKVYHEKLGVKNVDPLIERLGKMMSDVHGKVCSIQEVAATHADTIDRIVYGGGFEEVQKAATAGDRLIAGAKMQCVVPDKIKHPEKNVASTKHELTPDEQEQQAIAEKLQEMEAQRKAQEVRQARDKEAAKQAAAQPRPGETPVESVVREAEAMDMPKANDPTVSTDAPVYTDADVPPEVSEPDVPAEEVSHTPAGPTL